MSASAFTVQQDAFDFFLEVAAIDGDGNAVNLTGASSLKIKTKSPNGTETENTATFTTDGTDGKFRRLVVFGELDEAGAWLYQGFFKTSTYEGYTRPVEFQVLENL